MFKKTATIGSLSLLLAANAFAGPAAGDKTLLLSGSGGSDKKFDSNSFSGNAAIGYFATDALQLGVRQTMNVGTQNADVNNGKTKTNWNGVSRIFADYHFGTGTVLPFVGANIGGFYGDTVSNTGAAGLELGLKAYIQDQTYITFQAEYDYLFNSTDDFRSNFDDGAVFYSLGVGFNF